jgi:uncharacterized membrane protein YphA (DoxX/SURF4 family)
MLLKLVDKMFRKIITTDSQKTAILIRLMAGAVFLSEGIRKFLFADKLGSGRFAKTGIPNPDFFAPFVGSFEITCGLFVLLGLFTRLAAIPLIIIILMAIATTKAEVLANDGFWKMMHDGRNDWSMLLGSLFLLIKGGGKWSIDHQLQCR